MTKRFFSAPFMAFMLCWTLIPACVIAYYGMTDRSGAFTLANLVAIASGEHAKALGLSLLLAFASTVICLLLAFPLGLALKDSKLGKKGFIVFVFILPMWMNFLLRTMAWQVLLEKNGIINGMLASIGLPALNIINTPAAVILGMVYDYLPFMILPIYNSLSSIGDDVVEAGKDLGASYFTILRKIIFPLSLPGVISGITMVFVPSMTSFVISNILGGSNTLLIGNIIEQEFTYNFNWNLGSGLSFVLLVFTLISMGLMSVFDKSEGGNNIW